MEDNVGRFWPRNLAFLIQKYSPYMVEAIIGVEINRYERPCMCLAGGNKNRLAYLSNAFSNLNLA